MSNTKVIILLAFSLILVSTIITTQIPLADAVKSSGNSLTETNSKKICGVSLCDNPMTMKEKIQQYLMEKELQDGFAQQAFVGQGITSEGIKNLIKPTKAWQEDKKITENYDDTVLFTWTKDFTNIKPYFTIQKIQASDIGFNSNTPIDLDKMLAAYVSGLENFDYVDSGRETRDRVSPDRGRPSPCDSLRKRDPPSSPSARARRRSEPHGVGRRRGRRCTSPGSVPPSTR